MTELQAAGLAVRAEQQDCWAAQHIGSRQVGLMSLCCLGRAESVIECSLYLQEVSKIRTDMTPATSAVFLRVYSHVLDLSQAYDISWPNVHYLYQGVVMRPGVKPHYLLIGTFKLHSNQICKCAMTAMHMHVCRALQLSGACILRS